jgi:hypothetical protein
MDVVVLFFGLYGPHLSDNFTCAWFVGYCGFLMIFNGLMVF